MKNIFLDPAIVTIPLDLEDRRGFEEWLHTLQMWLKEALLSPYCWFHAIQVSYLLQAQGRFPSFEKLRTWQQRYHLDINLALLMRTINAFFRDEHFDLRNALEQLGYLIEVQEGSTFISPQHIPARWLPGIQNEMHQLFAHLCIYKYLQHPFAQEMAIVTLPLPDSLQEMSIITSLEVAVPDIVLESGNPRISQTFPLLVEPDDLASSFDILSLWQQGEKGIIYAIEQTYKKIWQETVPHPLKFHLGPYFLESVNKAGVQTNAVVLSKIIRYAAAVVAERAKDLNCDLHPFRTSKDANASQRIRESDGAKAWRLLLTDKGAGWRMHYWRISTVEGSVIEFANIQKKQEGEDIY